MAKKRDIATIRIFLVAICGVLTCCIWILVSVSDSSHKYLKVHFLDVGQGDAILIETPDGVTTLIDGGPDGRVTREIGSVLGMFDRSIDLVVGTHLDQDHIGGLVDVLQQYEAGVVFTNTHTANTPAAAAYLAGIEHEGAQKIRALQGQRYLLGASTTLEVLFPIETVGELERNASSIVLLVTYGETQFLLTGDAPVAIEEYLVGQYGKRLQSTVLKAGHHGSDTSTSELFLDTVEPEYVVISAGQDNRYGHPHESVVERIRRAGSVMLSTIEDGTITFLSDGERVWVERQ